jgi:hypothetical protein
MLFALPVFLFNLVSVVIFDVICPHVVLLVLSKLTWIHVCSHRVIMWLCLVLLNLHILLLRLLCLQVRGVLTLSIRNCGGIWLVLSLLSFNMFQVSRMRKW